MGPGLRLLALVTAAFMAGACASVPAPGPARVDDDLERDLLFVAPMLPHDARLSPSGDTLYVVDFGGLSARDPETLAVRRYLLPRVDGWWEADVDASGALVATTVHGISVRFDGEHLRAHRLPDRPPRSRGMYETAFERIASGPKAALGPFDTERGPLDTAAGRIWLTHPGVRGEQLLAFALADDGKRALVATLEHGVRLLEGDGAVSPGVFEGRRFTAMRAAGEGWVLGDARGGLVVLDASLAPVAAIDVAAPPRALAEVTDRTTGLVLGAAAPYVVSVDKRGERVAFTTSDARFGVWNTRSDALVVEQGTGLPGVRGVALAGRGAATLSPTGALTAWDLATGLGARKGGGYSSVAAHPDGTLVGGRSDQALEVFASTGSGVRCPFADGCPHREAMEALERARAARDAEAVRHARDALMELGIPRQVSIAFSPDGRRLATLRYPIRLGPARSKDATLELATWTWPELKSVAVRELAGPCADIEPSVGRGEVAVCGRRFALEDLQPGGEAANTVDVELAGGVRARVTAAAEPFSHDEVELVGAQGDVLGALAASDRALLQHRRQTALHPSPEGDLCAVYSRGAAAREGRTMLRLPGGPAMVLRVPSRAWGAVEDSLAVVPVPSGDDG